MNPLCLFGLHRWSYSVIVIHKFRGQDDPPPMPTQITRIQSVELYRECDRCGRKQERDVRFTHR